MMNEIKTVEELYDAYHATGVNIGVSFLGWNFVDGIRDAKTHELVSRERFVNEFPQEAVGAVVALMNSWLRGFHAALIAVATGALEVEPEEQPKIVLPSGSNLLVN